MSTDLKSKTDHRTRRPRRYTVIMLNDDFTPMDIVVFVLRKFFAMDEEAAAATMMTVHTRGEAPCGTYPLEIAETKIAQTMDLAREYDFPLTCRLKEA